MAESHIDKALFIIIFGPLEIDNGVRRIKFFVLVWTDEFEIAV